MSELRCQCDDGRLEVVIRVVPLIGPQADALRERQLAAIVTLLRRATTRLPAAKRTDEMTTPATGATVASPSGSSSPETPLDEVSP